MSVLHILLLSLLAGCGGEGRPEEDAATPGPLRPTPDSLTGGPVTELVGVRHLLVSWSTADAGVAERTREEALELAEDLLTELEVGGSGFDELARTYSDCPSAGRGGDLPDFSRGAVAEELVDASLSLGPGELSGIVESPYGFHIILRDR